MQEDAATKTIKECFALVDKTSNTLNKDFVNLLNLMASINVPAMPNVYFNPELIKLAQKGTVSLSTLILILTTIHNRIIQFQQLQHSGRIIRPTPNEQQPH